MDMNVYYIMVDCIGNVYRLNIYVGDYMIDVIATDVITGSRMEYRLWIDSKEEEIEIVSPLFRIVYEYEDVPDTLVNKVLDELESLATEGKVLAEFDFSTSS